MTVTISGVVTDVTARKDSREGWGVWSPVYRAGADGEIVTMRYQPVRVTAGVFTAELEPGVAVIDAPDGQSWTVTVPDEDSDLWDLIQAAASIPPDTSTDMLAAAVETFVENNPGYPWSGIASKPAFIAAGADEADARESLQMPTFSARKQTAVVDLRDWDVIKAGQWRTSLGAQYSNGATTIKNNVIPFTTADIGKKVIANKDAGGRWMATITDVNNDTGVAEVDTTISGSASNQRVQWGFDITTTLNAALVELGASNDHSPRECYLPGWYRATQIVGQQLVTMRGASWGDYQFVTGGRSATRLQQLPGSQKDFIVFDSSDANYVGPFGLKYMNIRGPEINVSGQAATVGNGINIAKPDGTRLITQDGVELAWLHVTLFPENGFKLNGGVPLTLNNCRPFYNGLYGIDFIPKTPSAVQMIHLLNCSGDGNNLGLARFKDMSEYGSVLITALKGEWGDSSGAAEGQGTPNFQKNLLIFEDCDNTAVVVNGATQIPGTSHAGVDGAGPCITIKSATTKRPRLVFNGVTNRLQGAESGSVADAVTIRDEVTGVDVPRTVVSGSYPSNATNKRIIHTVTSSVTLGDGTDYVTYIGASGAPTLPTAVGNSARYAFKNIHTSDRVVATTSSQTIDGSTTFTLSPGAAIEFVSDGSNWRVF